MSSTAQISATISESTKEQLDRFAVEFGLQRDFVIEQSLLFYMESWLGRPEGAIPTRLVLDHHGFDDFVARLQTPGAPTGRLGRLLRG